MINRKATLSEIDNTIRWLLELDWVKKEYSDNWGWWHNKLQNITYKQKRFINALILSKNKTQLYEILNSITFK